MSRDEFESVVRPRNGAITNPFNIQPDGLRPDYAEVIYQARLEAGSATGTPPDAPAFRVDPNDAAARFPGVGSLEIAGELGVFLCSGTIIDASHVLSAAHCFDFDDNGSYDEGLYAVFHLNDGSSPVHLRTTDVALHPEFVGFSKGAFNDLAVVTLETDVPDTATIYPIHAGDLDVGDVIELVGYGSSGFGDVGGREIDADFYTKRSGRNEVDIFVADNQESDVNKIFIYDFDGPVGTGWTGGVTLGNDTETTVRYGDSGGPAFFEVGGVLSVAGVNTFQFAVPGITPSPGVFGVLGGGTIITEPFLTWITSIATEASTVTLLLGDFNEDGVLDVEDINLLSHAVGSEEADFDLNFDAVIDDEDRRIWVEQLVGTFYGDANLDGQVQFDDFLFLSANYGLSGNWGDGDFSGNGEVQFEDFLLLKANFGNYRGMAASVSEPIGSLWMLFVVVFFVRPWVRCPRLGVFGRGQ